MFKGESSDMTQRYVDLRHNYLVTWGTSKSVGWTWWRTYTHNSDYAKWVRTTGDNSIDLETGYPKARIDKSGNTSYKGPDLWKFYNYVVRMDRLHEEHMARFTGHGANLPEYEGKVP